MEAKPYWTLEKCLEEIRQETNNNIECLQQAYSELEIQKRMLKLGYSEQVNSIHKQQANIKRQIDALYISLESYTPKNINDLDSDD